MREIKKKNDLSVVVLAAGKGSRLNISTPKPLLNFCGKKLIDYSIEASKKLFKDLDLNGNICSIVNYQKNMILNHLKSRLNVEDDKLFFVDQEEALGTGHAILQYFNKTNEDDIGEYLIVTCADTPLIHAGVFKQVYTKIVNENLDSVVATFCLNHPIGYGRIIKNNNQFTIVEEKDATTHEREISEVNSGFYIFKTSFLHSQIKNINNLNNSKEYYLTDIFKYSKNSKTLLFEDSSLFGGINTLSQLEKLEKIYRKNLVLKFQNNGVQFIDSENVYIDADVIIKKDVVIYPNVHLRGKTTIGSKVLIDTGCIIENSTIEESVHLKAYSHLENSTVKAACIIGPYARLRPGSIIERDCKIGNFVEIKKSKLLAGVKVSHLSYVGDAEIGKNTNIGCGFITCNYDGKNKHKTVIGKECFIGSDTQTIAPVNIGDECFIASGSTINNDMPSGSFAISRSRQITKNDFAKKFIKK